jgi:hypothetical protein
MARKLKLQPIPRNALPKSLRQFPDLLASELYRYRAVERGPAHAFYQHYEKSRLAQFPDRSHVAFRFHDIIIFFARAAGEGVIGNIAYASLGKAIKAIRKPKQELFNANVSFEAFLSRSSYNRVRKVHNETTIPIQRTLTTEFEAKLETQYRLMVMLKREKQ